MKKTRLFIDAHVFDDPFQGSRTYLLGLYSEMIKQNTAFEFIFGAYNIENIKKEFGEHSNVRYIKYMTTNKFLRLALNIPLVILRNKIDISHYQYIAPLIKLSKEIVTIHDVLFLDYPELFPVLYRIKNRILFRRSARRADILLTVSDYSKARIAEHFRISKDDIVVLPDAVGEEFFEPVGQLPDVKVKYNIDNYILYVSRIEPRKNHLMLLRAFVELELWKKGFQLVFIGEKSITTPEYENYWQSLSDDIKASVRLINGSYGNELKSFYRNCRLFVYPSIAEGFGIPPLEAVASHAPTICSKSTAMGDFKFMHDRLFDPLSIGELKEKIIKYLHSNQNYDREIEYIKLNYNWSNVGKGFKKVLAENGII
ncbi:MAG: glycosyltransferase family 4 protein [Bacteroidales bacterium]|nr:glycosyltransferase family 4 protein [Bacteroidales bacterium]